MLQLTRSEIWKDIWTRKGQHKEAPLHHANGYDLLSWTEWEALVAEVCRPIGLTGKDNILDCGCGAGAFLKVLSDRHPGLKFTGLDYSPSLVERARERLQGDFLVADITDLRFLDSARFDHTISFGTMMYLGSEEAVVRALEGMVRVTKPGGMIYIGEVSDLAKRAQAESIRVSSHQGVKKLSTATADHLYLPKDLFEDVARTHQMDVTVVDHSTLNLGSYQAARYRYSVYFRKSP
jgi:ubiquinone/menaquinone biosynthesis C-methylase UbiE